MKTLQNSIIAGLPFEKLEEICFGPFTPLGNALDCPWELWRERAFLLYGTPYDFFLIYLDSFDLPPREISGVQRYIEVSNYYQLTPQAGVKVYPSVDYQGEIIYPVEGIYEGPAGLKRRSLPPFPFPEKSLRR